MKRIIIALLSALALGTDSWAQSDTLIIQHPDQVSVLTAGDTLSISVVGQKDNPGFYYQKTVLTDSVRENVTTTSRNVRSGLGWDFSLLEERRKTPQLVLNVSALLYAGWNIPVGKPSGMHLKGFASTEVGVDLLHLRFHPRNDRWHLSLDWGMSMGHYKFKNCMMTGADGKTIFTPFPEGSSSQSSSFMTLSSNLTLMGHYRLGKDHELGLGVMWKAQTSDNCSYKSKYTLPDGTPIVDMNELPIRGNLFSIKLEYMYAKRTGVFLRYTPMPILHSDRAPSFQQLNVGLQVRL